MRERSTRSEPAEASPKADVFRRIHDAHVRAITAYCTRRTPSERVEDAVAETFLVAWRRIDDLLDESTALLWLYRIAHHVVGHEKRSIERRRRLVERLGSLRPTTASGPEHAAVVDEEIQLVLQAASELNASDAEILRLACWERLTRVEIAAVLDLEPNAVSQRLHRARSNLTRRYERVNRADHSPAVREGGA